MKAKYKIDRNTGTFTKSIESFSPENGKPKQSHLKMMESKYKNGKEFAEMDCKPIIGITNVKTWSDIGITSAQSLDWMQNDEAKYERESKKLNKATCEVLEKKF